MRREIRQAPPLDPAALERLALRYVERFAITRGQLADYLVRKIRERGWDGAPADPAALAQRLADLGYVDDRAFAEAKAGALGRRGLGGRRVADALRQARVGEADAAHVAPAVAERAVDTALAYARRRRIGPFGADGAAPDLRRRQLAAMLRAGHGFELSRRIVAAEPAESVDPDDFA